MKHHNSIHLYINTIQCHFELIKGVQKWVSRMVCIIMFKVIRCLWLSNCAFFSVIAMKVLVVWFDKMYKCLFCASDIDWHGQREIPPHTRGQAKKPVFLTLTLRINWKVNQPNSIPNTLSSPSLSRLQNL